MNTLWWFLCWGANLGHFPKSLNWWDEGWIFEIGKEKWKRKKRRIKREKREGKQKLSFFPKCWCLQQDIKFFKDTNDEQLGQFLCPSGAYIAVIKKKEIALWQNTEPLYFTRGNRKGEIKNTPVLFGDCLSLAWTPVTYSVHSKANDCR